MKEAYGSIRDISFMQTTSTISPAYLSSMRMSPKDFKDRASTGRRKEKLSCMRSSPHREVEEQ